MTTQSFEERKRQHKRHAKRGSNIFHKAIIKYGFDSFKWEILYQTNSLEDLGNKETELILLSKSYDRNFGYNQKTGGQIGWKYSEDVKKKMSLAKMGKSCKNSHSQKVGISVFKNEEFIGNWQSLSECAKTLGLDQGNISKYLKLNRPLKGFTFLKSSF